VPFHWTPLETTTAIGCGGLALGIYNVVHTQLRDRETRTAAHLLVEIATEDRPQTGYAQKHLTHDSYLVITNRGDRATARDVVIQVMNESGQQASDVITKMFPSKIDQIHPGQSLRLMFFPLWGERIASATLEWSDRRRGRQQRTFLL
jgi:hypothetical protein